MNLMYLDISNKIIFQTLRYSAYFASLRLKNNIDYINKMVFINYS
jgi:hypothetical protein